VRALRVNVARPRPWRRPRIGKATAQMSSAPDLSSQRSGLGRLKDLLIRLLATEAVRFLLVGATNTVVGYLLYSLLWVTVGHVIGYLGSLYGSYAVAIVLAFFLYRKFVFRVKGHAWLDFVRFQGVYIVSLVINTLALPLLVEVVKLSPLVAQAVIVIVTTLTSYVGHKFFSFRRRNPSTDRGTGGQLRAVDHSVSINRSEPPSRSAGMEEENK
jgi:putative flippase GtrA